ncbi:MAG: thioredoxin-dependent thiol peroxidase [Myxococcota bacterium]|nr:thioredoxin-dependent thiol peroxidase [Myxococcota bacterium]
MLSVGDQAPNFTHLDQHGQEVSLTDFRGQKVLIWFYPKASTPGCTAEGCNIRDNYAELQAANVRVIGISKDSVKRQSNFATKYEFPYTLLADQDGVTVNAYGCWGPKKFMGREFDGIIRKSFLVDEEGKLERIYEKVKTKTHGADVLADL